ncbi:ribosome biogenesis factor YjgA [Aliagarivorans taiwanensis]|uniref:ribosome biogenesis factor YjgA n=1 Tax=Aliagarivorans taiwanensis TaxID=561966 RepID=UPI000429B646|nr:ribosome biogenesis factor YjgA [Aliagarivorans taiwanensis]
MSENEVFDDDEWVSKSQIKREAEELKDLGKELTNLSKQQLDTIDMSEELLDALMLAKRLQAKREREGLRRHFNYIGKLMRESDTDAIRAGIEKIRNRHLYAAQAQQRMEKLRDRLLEEGDAGINQLIEDHPELDRQWMRQLVRQASKEKKAEKPGKNYKELAAYLKSVIEA